ncbi:PadR family transcriptional regulator [uncultured Tessaracoccus sp.]|uniref:PadR family transcriptional regulator n=1 Tax=uncultured Tessaracoccus sp. TaxID=905023 RepID=UPI0025F73E7A|nr:PadR family transcriptional regulator [uncultured Tessaracoccus sp.]
MADSQLRKGALELVVLVQLEARPTYGGALLARLAELGLDISSGTLYPMLTRLKKAQHVASHWEESPSGPPRKVYTVTARGRRQLRTLARDWRALSTVVDAQLEGIDS